MADLVVRGGTVVLPGVGPVSADVAVEDGRIAAIGPELPGARETVDARGLHVLPGVLDAHVHFNEPGRSDWEGWETGSRALAAGGATACVEMPLNARPPTVDGAAFDAKAAAAAASSVVDFALWGGLVPGDLDRLDELAERGVAGFKAFMCDSGIDDFPAADEDTLGAGMARAAALGLPVAVHAESPARLSAPAGAGWREFVASRPVAAELEAIERALALAAETGCSLHVVHVSTGAGVALVAEARARGVDATCETCPHYLALTEDDLERLGTAAKCAPPLRPAAERDALWEHLAAGRIRLVASDHSPAPPALKAGSFADAWGGIAGCQSLLELLLDEGHHARGVPLALLAALTSEQPARRFGLHAKGRLQPGADADLALVDLGAERVLRREDLHDRHRLSPFAGRTLRGRVVRTLVRGVTVFRDGQIVARPHGRLLKPTRGAPG
jgi:allantoinase